MLSHNIDQAIMDLLADCQERTAYAIAQHLCIHQATAIKHLQSLCISGKIKRIAADSDKKARFLYVLI